MQHRPNESGSSISAAKELILMKHPAEKGFDLSFGERRARSAQEQPKRVLIAYIPGLAWRVVTACIPGLVCKFCANLQACLLLLRISLRRAQKESRMITFSSYR
eukprot:977146-Pelagomonas_calceolata.AAC.4